MTNSASSIPITKIDHVAITVADLDHAAGFYVDLGGEIVRSYDIDGRRMVLQLHIGGAMLNIHQAGHTHPLVAGKPTPGSTDLCFRWGEPIASGIALLDRLGIAIIDGPSERHASDGLAGISVYFRDPDGNLLEFLSTVEGGLSA